MGDKEEFSEDPDTESSVLKNIGLFEDYFQLNRIDCLSLRARQRFNCLEYCVMSNLTICSLYLKTNTLGVHSSSGLSTFVLEDSLVDGLY